MPISNLVAPARYGTGSLGIINAGLAGVDTAGTAVSQPWTTVAGTTLLVIVFTIGAAGQNHDFTAVAFNAVPVTGEIGIGGNSPRDSHPGQQWFYLKNPSIGAFNITYTKVGASWTSNSYHLVQCFNIRGDHLTSPIGASDFPATVSTDALTADGSIVATSVNSILLAAGSWQGGDTDPFTADEGLTKLNEAESGTNVSADGVTAIAWKQLGAAGSYNYGFTSSSADGYGISAVEVNKAA